MGDRAQALETEILPVESAFVISVSQISADEVQLDWKIDDCCYLYKDKFKFVLGDQTLSDIEYPTPILKDDPQFGISEIYHNSVSIKLPIPKLSKFETLTVYSQGCNEPIGVCYTPKKVQYDIGALFGESQANSTNPELDSIPNNRIDSSFWPLALGAFLAGLFLTFTPCVLPMIPIMSSIITGQGNTLSHSKGASLAATFVLGTAVTYAMIGAVAGATGQQLQAYFQHPAVIIGMSVLLSLMALSMFGFFQLQMPSFIQSRLQEKSQRLGGGQLSLVFSLGLISALVVGACVSPVLISILGVAMTTGSPLIGASVMFIMALGMGIPLILFGLGAGALLPRAGQWMNTIKSIFGFILIGVALNLMQSVQQVPVLMLWAALLIVTGVFLGATQALTNADSVSQKISKGLGTIALIWGTLALIGGMYGERNVLHPLPQFLLSNSNADNMQVNDSPFEHVETLLAIDEKIQLAKSIDKQVLLDFSADWCTDCKKLEQTTFSDSRVRAAIVDQFVALKIDLTNPNSEATKAIKKRFNVFGPPAIRFVKGDSGFQDYSGFYGYVTADQMLEKLNQALN